MLISNVHGITITNVAFCYYAGYSLSFINNYVDEYIELYLGLIEL